MPIYEYICKACSRHVEVRQKITDDPLKHCQECGGELEKQWSRTGFQFKGEGWYVTDYAGKGAVKGKEEKSASAESTTAGEGASKPKEATAKSDAGAKKD